MCTAEFFFHSNSKPIVNLLRRPSVRPSNELTDLGEREHRPRGYSTTLNKILAPTLEKRHLCLQAIEFLEVFASWP